MVRRSKGALLIVASVLPLLGGCAYSTPIQPVASSVSAFDGAVYGGETVTINPNTEGAEEYRVFHQAATGFNSVQEVRDDAERRAKEFCDRKGNVLRLLRETTSKPPHILGNFPRVEIVFTCVEKPKSVAPAAADDAKYTKLLNLKKLL